MTVRVLCVLLIISLLSLAGCSSIRSSSSPFRWSSSPFKWSSASSGGDGEAQAEREQTRYQRDVESATKAAVAAGGGPQQIMREVGAVAGEHGVTDWENEPDTFEAIGRGLRDVSLDRFELWSEALTGGSEVRQKLLLEGYTGGS